MAGIYHFFMIFMMFDVCVCVFFFSLEGGGGGLTLDAEANHM